MVASVIKSPPNVLSGKNITAPADSRAHSLAFQLSVALFNCSQFSSCANRNGTKYFSIIYHCFIQRMTCIVSVGKDCVNYFECNCFIGGLYSITCLLEFLFASWSVISMICFHIRVQRWYLFL